jgi:hypothetical protein
MCAGGLPPDPASIAPPLDRTIASTVYDQTHYLYTGTTPVQTGVAANTIDVKRVGVVRGRVITDDGAALSGVTITALNHPEFGQTLTRLDGRYDFVLNGGSQLVLDYKKTGYLPVQRTFDVDWQEFVNLPDVIMVPPDEHVTPVTMGAATYQVARGSVVTDADGTRQGTVLIPPGTQAMAVDASGTSTPLSTMSVRITEYTVGEDGDKRMPASLPPDSEYTYAFEIGADEATQVEFNQPVVYYVDNFLGFQIGTSVPLGSYCRSCCGKWMQENNGLVMKVLSVSNGIATLDTNGDGIGETATFLQTLGITGGETAQIAQLYSPGASVWRLPLPHFSTWDPNPGSFPPPDAVPSTTGDAITEYGVECRQDAGVPRSTPSVRPSTRPFQSWERPTSSSIRATASRVGPTRA